jgi:hypothetical protein
MLAQLEKPHEHKAHIQLGQHFGERDWPDCGGGRSVTTWRYFARKTFPRVARELNLPAAHPNPQLTFCPLHHTPIGPITHLCEVCFRTAWDEVGRRYATRAQGEGRTTHGPRHT